MIIEVNIVDPPDPFDEIVRNRVDILKKQVVSFSDMSGQYNVMVKGIQDIYGKSQ